MKKFISRNIMICSFLIVALFFVLKASSVPYFVPIPNFVVDSFNKLDLDSTIFEIVELLSNIGLAYIASFIFYVLVEYIPQENKAKRAFKVIEENLSLVALQLCNLIALIEFKAREAGIEIPINAEQRQEMDKLTFTDERVYLKRDDASWKVWYTFFNYRKDLNNYSKKIKMGIDKIVSTSSYSQCDFELLEIISLIQNNQIWTSFNIIGTINHTNMPTQYSDFGKSFCRLVESRDKLEFYVLPKDHYKYTRQSDEEIKEHNLDIEQFSEGIRSELGLPEDFANGIFRQNRRII